MGASRWITVDGGRYRVVETLGYQPSAGVYAKEVRDGDGYRIAVSERRGGPWRFWTTRDMVQPLGLATGEGG